MQFFIAVKISQVGQPIWLALIWHLGQSRQTKLRLSTLWGFFLQNIFMLVLGLCSHQQSAHDGWVRKEQCLLAHNIKQNNVTRAPSKTHTPTTPIYVILPTTLFLDHNATTHKASSNINTILIRALLEVCAPQSALINNLTENILAENNENYWYKTEAHLPLCIHV